MDSIERETGGNKSLVDITAGLNVYGLASSNKVGHSIKDIHIFDVDNSLLVAGNYSEEVIALDYRENMINLKVLGLFTGSWILLADSFDECADRIDLYNLLIRSSIKMCSE